jgi:hypothetical protein
VNVETKVLRKHWMHTHSPGSKRKEADGNSFLGQERKLMVEFKQQRTTMTSELYCTTQKKCIEPSRTKGMECWHTVLCSSMTMHHLLKGTAACTRELLDYFSCVLFDHLPYSPDLVSSNYHLFTHLKNLLWSQHFRETCQSSKVVLLWHRNTKTYFPI